MQETLSQAIEIESRSQRILQRLDTAKKEQVVREWWNVRDEFDQRELGGLVVKARDSLESRGKGLARRMGWSGESGVSEGTSGKMDKIKAHRLHLYFGNLLVPAEETERIVTASMGVMIELARFDEPRPMIAMNREVYEWVSHLTLNEDWLMVQGMVLRLDQEEAGRKFLAKIVDSVKEDVSRSLRACLYHSVRPEGNGRKSRAYNLQIAESADRALKFEQPADLERLVSQWGATRLAWSHFPKKKGVTD